MTEILFTQQLKRIGIDLNKCTKEEAIKFLDEKIEEEKKNMIDANKKLTEIYQNKLRKRQTRCKGR